MLSSYPAEGGHWHRSIREYDASAPRRPARCPLVGWSSAGRSASRVSPMPRLLCGASVVLDWSASTDSSSSTASAPTTW